MPTEMELTLEQTQQGVSYEVSVFTMKMEILLEPTSNKLMVEHAEYDESNTYVLERFNTTAGNPVKKILLKLNLSDHRLFKYDGGEVKQHVSTSVKETDNVQLGIVNQAELKLFHRPFQIVCTAALPELKSGVSLLEVYIGWGKEKEIVYVKGIKQSPWEKDFQDSHDDEEDTRQEYINDLEEEYQARSLLAKSKRFFKKGTQRFSGAKATDQTECHKCGKKGHFTSDCWSKTSVPSYQSTFSYQKLLNSSEAQT
ncbi:retrovirus-related pol polyprotein from transposon TNT 1-94 [Tanacetum coccineum]